MKFNVTSLSLVFANDSEYMGYIKKHPSVHCLVSYTLKIDTRSDNLYKTLMRSILRHLLIKELFETSS